MYLHYIKYTHVIFLVIIDEYEAFILENILNT